MSKILILNDGREQYIAFANQNRDLLLKKGKNIVDDKDYEEIKDNKWLQLLMAKGLVSLENEKSKEKEPKKEESKKTPKKEKQNKPISTEIKKSTEDK